MRGLTAIRKIKADGTVRRLVLSWLFSALLQYTLLPAELKDLSDIGGIARMSFGTTMLMTVLGTFILTLISMLWNTAVAERILSAAIFGVLSAVSLAASFSPALLAACAVIFAILVVYAVRGKDTDSGVCDHPSTEHKGHIAVAAAICAVFFLFVSAWTVCRVLSFSTPTYDFGIFAQMFENMRKTGIPVTTVEREVTMSHFNVHVSPIYYTLLPFYFVIPRPETLQVLQAAVMASSVIPLWKLSKHHGISPLLRTLLCALLLVYPALAGGASYDLHENCFLTPLILWMLYGIDKTSLPIISVSALLTLTVKEDAAVYVAVAALWLIVKTLVGNGRRKKGLITGAVMLAVSIAYFLLTTAYLANVGDGVMTGRYKNFMYDESGSLITVIKAVIMCPMKALFECADPEKLTFTVQTLLPLLGLPFISRRFDRYILLIPYVLLNLMSDYVYQHDIYFQYTFGSLAFLFYLTAVNLSDMKRPKPKLAVMISALLISTVSFSVLIIPKGIKYPKYYFENAAYFSEVSQTLDLIPDGASVAATGFYTTHLADHELLYDVHYSTREQLLSCEYIALDKGLTGDYRSFKHKGKTGYKALLMILEENGYTLSYTKNKTVIYRKTE